MKNVAAGECAGITPFRHRARGSISLNPRARRTPAARQTDELRRALLLGSLLGLAVIAVFVLATRYYAITQGPKSNRTRPNLW